MHRATSTATRPTDSAQITALRRRLSSAVLGDAEYRALQAQLEDLAPRATRSPAGGEDRYPVEPPF